MRLQKGEYMDKEITNVENDLKYLMQIYRDKIKDVDRDISMWEKDLTERDIAEKEIKEINALISKKQSRRDDYIRIVDSLECAYMCVWESDKGLANSQLNALQSENEMLKETVRLNVQKIEQYMKHCSDCSSSHKA